jgi:hypothetical protein
MGFGQPIIYDVVRVFLTRAPACADKPFFDLHFWEQDEEGRGPHATVDLFVTKNAAQKFDRLAQAIEDIFGPYSQESPARVEGGESEAPFKDSPF